MALQHRINSGETLLHFVHNGFEAFRIAEGDLGEGFTVQGDLGDLQFVHEDAVGHAVFADGGVDTLDPEGAEVALLDLAADVGVVVSFFNGVHRNGEHVLPATEIAFGLLEDLFAAGAAGDFILCAWHLSLCFRARASVR